MQRVEVAVVGGGLAGSATAVHLARRGHEVCVLERGTGPREKVCGEGLMPHGVECLQSLGVLDALHEGGAVPFVGIGYHHRDTVAFGRFPDRKSGATGLGVRRLLLDHTLAELAVRTDGVQVRNDVRVKGLRQVDDGVVLRTSAGEVHARAVVGADGLHSIVRREAGLRVKQVGHQRFGARLHYRLRDGVDVGDLVHVYLRPDLEFYVTPTGAGQLNIAVLCDKALTKTLGGRLHQGLMQMASSDPDLAEWLDGAEPISQGGLCGPLRQRVRSAATERIVLVGDAAGFVDAITGEGMSLGLMAAELAAEELSSALSEGDLSARRLARYNVRKRRQSWSVLWLTHIVLWGMRDRRLAAWMVRNLARSPASFDRVLAVQSHQRSLWQIGPMHALRLLAGL